MRGTIEELYNETANIEVKFAEYPQPFGVEMINDASRYGSKTKQDCKIGSWTENVFFRTEKGTWNNDERYSSISELKSEIISAAKERNLTVEEFIIKEACS